MKRFELFLDRLNHNDHPPEEQSPVQTSAAAALVSFLIICWLDKQVISSLGVWWAELLAYAFVPILLAFIILYRSSWHRESRAWARTVLAGLFSCIIFAGVLMVMGMAAVLIALAYYSNFDGFPRFHY